MPSPLLTRKNLLMAKVETTYGTDASPFAASNSILAENLKVKPIYDIIDRGNVALPDLSKIPHLVGRRWAEISFDVELKGSSDADGDVPPDFGCLLRACSMSEAITAGPSGNVTYAPVSTAQDSVTIYCNLDGILHKFVGCVGSFAMAGEVGQPVKITFNMKGKLLTISDSALGTPTYINLKPPLVLGATFSYDGWSPPLAKFSIDLKNTIAERPDVHQDSGIVGFFVSDRAPEGKFDPEAVTIANRDVWHHLAEVNEAALNIVIGSTAGNKCTIAAPRCTKKEVAWGDRDGLAVYDITYGLYRSSGNDELSIKFE